ncbi:MAG TPA: hypothetical protein VFS00_35210 [Polyangiaceae bacterium]|nr:hypothetical protein [Polyangiaceae bacterium]
MTSPPLWLLDDGPFWVLSRFFDPAWAWPEGLMAVVREVADAAKRDKTGRREALLAMRAPSGGPSVAVHDGGPAANAMLWEHLRPRAAEATKNLGEDVSIAVCATELPSAVFVAMDKRSVYVALAELGRGRVASPFDLWASLEQAGHISDAVFQGLCETTCKQDQGLVAVPKRFQR